MSIVHDAPKELAFAGRLVMVGFGCIGQGVLPLLLRHIELRPAQIMIVGPGDTGAEVAQSHGVHRLVLGITADNLDQVMRPLLGPDNFLLNLSVDVSSAALVPFCHKVGAVSGHLHRALGRGLCRS